MELRRLQYFAAVAAAGTVSAAAERVHITQPSLSRQLRLLENELGVALFDRAGGRMTLSAAGHELLPRVHAVLAAAHGLTADAAFLAQGGLLRIVIAAPTVTLTDVVSPFVTTMSAMDPVVDVNSGDGLSTTTMLDRGADLAIGTRAAKSPFFSRTLATLPVWAYVTADDPWGGRTRISLGELAERQVIALPKTFTAREALDAAVTVAGVSIGEVLAAANGTVAQALAVARRGIAVVSDDPRYGLRPLAITTGSGVLAVQLVAAWDPRRAAACYLEELASRISNWIDERYDGALEPALATNS